METKWKAAQRTGTAGRSVFPNGANSDSRDFSRCRIWPGRITIVWLRHGFSAGKEIKRFPWATYFCWHRLVLCLYK